MSQNINHYYYYYCYKYYYIHHSPIIQNIYSTPSVCWVLEKPSKYSKIGFLNDSINIYSMPFMGWVLEKNQ